MKILITTDWYKPVVNGVVTSVLNLSEGLEKRGHEVKILTLSPDRHYYEEENVIYMGSFGMGYVYPNARMKIPLFHRELQKLLDWKPDVIHSQCEFSTFFVAKKISETLHIPIIHTYHTIYEDYTHYFSINKKWGKSITTFLTKKLSNQVSTIIAPTEKIQRLLYGYGVSCMVEIVPSGIDLEKYQKKEVKDWKQELRNTLGISDDKYILLYVGRLAKEKNMEELLEFQKEAASAGTVLVIAGDGPSRKELENYARKIGVDDTVFFIGMVPPEHIDRYYKAGDLFVSASTSETQGLTYAEALASGLPLLCRQDTCLKQLVKEGKNGWQYEDRESFMRQLSQWIRMEKEEKEKLCREAEESIHFLSKDAFVEMMEKIYQREVKWREYAA